MPFSDDLSDIASAASGARQLLSAVAADIEHLRSAIVCAKRAWSGSNLGYHATVYYVDLQAVPPGVQFSPEWGLKDAWPIHQPDPGWRQMNFDTVVDRLLADAGITKINEVRSIIEAAGKSLSRLKERAISALELETNRTRDPFLRRKLDQITALVVAEPDTVANSLVTKGAGWSRDSTAVTQGLRLAPHQSLLGVALAFKANSDGLETLAESCGEALQYAWKSAGSDLRSKPAETSPIIPAADRTVALDHNSADLSTLHENLDSLATAVGQSNDFPIDDDKDQRIGEIKAGKTLLQAAHARALAVWSVLGPTLRWFVDKFSGGLISQLAVAAIKLLRTIFGF
jgi:hypothetical protein